MPDAEQPIDYIQRMGYGDIPTEEAMALYNNQTGVCRRCPEAEDLSADTDYTKIAKYNDTCASFIVVAGPGGNVLADPKVQDMLDAIWTMIVTMTTVGYGVFFPLQAAGKITSLFAALFGSFYMAMPLTIVGSEFYDIYQEVQIEDDLMQSNMDKIFRDHLANQQKKTLEVDNRLSLSQVSKLKLKTSSAKDRVREMGLHKDEIEQAFAYISNVEEVSLFLSMFPLLFSPPVRL